MTDLTCKDSANVLLVEPVYASYKQLRSDRHMY